MKFVIFLNKTHHMNEQTIQLSLLVVFYVTFTFFVTQYQPSVSTLKEVLMKNWNLIQNQPLLRQIFKEPPIISYKKGKSLKDMLVRAKIWKVYTRFHAGMDVRPVTPCIFLTNEARPR